MNNTQEIIEGLNKCNNYGSHAPSEESKTFIINNAITRLQELEEKVEKFEAKEFKEWEDRQQPDYVEKR